MEELASSLDLKSTSSVSQTENDQINVNKHKSWRGKILFILIIFFAFFTLFLYSFNRFVYPVITFIPESLKPWGQTEGKSCNFGGCVDSEINKIYNYYSQLAVTKHDSNFCNNVQGYDTGDTGISPKEYAIKQCKIEYSKKTGDQKVCESLPPDSKVQCVINIAQIFSKPELYSIDLCNELIDADKIGKCMANLSLNTKTYSCNKASNKDIEKACNSELFKFHGDALNNLNGLDVIKDKKEITVPLVSKLWGASTETLGINPDGTLALWLNGTRYSCKFGEEVNFRSNGPDCSSIPIYHISKCLLQGDKATLEYFTYNVNCQW